MRLADILIKVRQETIWKSYVAATVSQNKVLGGCVLSEHKIDEEPVNKDES